MAGAAWNPEAGKLAMSASGLKRAQPDPIERDRMRLIAFKI
jgi:hypothetical protein